MNSVYFIDHLEEITSQYSTSLLLMNRNYLPQLSCPFQLFAWPPSAPAVPQGCSGPRNIHRFINKKSFIVG